MTTGQVPNTTSPSADGYRNIMYTLPVSYDMALDAFVLEDSIALVTEATAVLASLLPLR